MGTKQTKIDSQQITAISKNLLIQLAFPKISEKFEKAQFFYKTREMKIHLPVDNSNCLKKWDQSLKMLVNDEMKKYILLPKEYDFQKQGICGSAGLAKIVYDYFPYSLEGQIQNRKKIIDNQQFSEAEIWKILYTLLKACHSMHVNWRKVGDIRPKNIFYNQQKQLRISSQISYPIELTNYENFVFEKQPTYISPEQIHDIKMGRIDFDKSRNAKQHIIESESWSIGLTLLHVLLLFNFQKLYDPLKLQININLLHQKLLDLQNNKKFSVALKNVTKGMIQEIPQRRLLCSELLLNILAPYTQNIQNLEQFDKTKLNQQIRQVMEKKAINSLIGTVWKACATGLVESLVINNIRDNQKESKAKEVLLEQLEKFSEIPPKNSHVSMRQSIKLGGSRKKTTNSVAKRKSSQTSNESFHTVNSLKISKKSSAFANTNKISNFGIQNRFAGLRIPTSGSNFSPMKNNQIDNISEKFMTPLQQSSYFQSINPNQRSFDFNSLILLSSRFRNSQTLDNKDPFKKLDHIITNSQQVVLKEGNFKKQKSKQKS